MSATRRRFAQEFKDELCREVISTSKPIKEFADAYGVGPETLRNWLHKLNRPGFVGDFILWKRGWSHGQKQQDRSEVFG
jgi:transposase-like protein